MTIDATDCDRLLRVMGTLQREIFRELLLLHLNLKLVRLKS